MRVFIYEFISGGGLLSARTAEIPASLLAEGTAMVTALAADYAAVPGCAPVLLRDHRLGRHSVHCCEGIHVATAEQERAAFIRLAAASDWTVVIAPEFSGNLLSNCQQAVAAGGRLLGPGLVVVALCADKQATADHLRASGIPVPSGCVVPPDTPLPDDFIYPAVLKPRDGAGSQGVRLIAAKPVSGEVATRLSVPGRLERFYSGLAASVSCIRGPADCFWLPPCRQHLSDDGRFTYLGGSLPLPLPLANRATKLAQKAVAALPSFIGYLGIDLVLGKAVDGSQDVVIEVNPRLTTSYVGLRAAASSNLAAVMLALAAGASCELSFHPVQVEFNSNGDVYTTPLTSLDG